MAYQGHEPKTRHTNRCCAFAASFPTSDKPLAAWEHTDGIALQSCLIHRYWLPPSKSNLRRLSLLICCVGLSDDLLVGLAVIKDDA